MPTSAASTTASTAAMRAGADSRSSIDAAAHSNRRGSEGAAISKVRSLEKPSSSSDGDAAWPRGVADRRRQQQRPGQSKTRLARSSIGAISFAGGSFRPPLTPQRGVRPPVPPLRLRRGRRAAGATPLVLERAPRFAPSGALRRLHKLSWRGQQRRSHRSRCASLAVEEKFCGSHRVKTGPEPPPGAASAPSRGRAGGSPKAKLL
jgi:hypothetical protein